MRIILVAVLALLAACAAVPNAGDFDTPSEKLAAAKVTYATALDGLTALSPQLSKAMILQLEEARKAARATIDIAEAHQNEVGFTALASQALLASQAFLRAYQEIKSGKNRADAAEPAAGAAARTAEYVPALRGGTAGLSGGTWAFA